MESLRVDKETILNDENDILDNITDFFVDWHSGKEVFLRGLHTDEDILNVSLKLKDIKFSRLIKRDSLHGLSVCEMCHTVEPYPDRPLDKCHRMAYHSGRPRGHKDLWMEVYESRELFMKLTEECGAPVELRDIIWCSIQSTSTRLDCTSVAGDSLRQEMSALLKTVPSYENFSRHIKKPSGGMAPGMSGLTFGLMSIWPEKVIKRVYDCLVTFWFSPE